MYRSCVGLIYVLIFMSFTSIVCAQQTGPNNAVNGASGKNTESDGALQNTQNLAAPETQTGINISGNWYDPNSRGSKIFVVQNGKDFSYSASSVMQSGNLTGIGFDVVGKGSISTNSLSVNFTTRFGNGQMLTGHCSGTAPKIVVILWDCNDSWGNRFNVTWIAE